MDVFQSLESLIKSSTTHHPPSTSAAEILAEVGAPTASIAILDHGEISSYCISTLESNNTNTLFQACSISKPVFGCAIMRLVDLGHISVDSKIHDLLPSEIFNVLTRDPRHERFAKEITVKQLMSHSAGLGIGGFPGYPDHDRVPDAMEVLKGGKGVNTQTVNFVSLPGSEFSYSGGGITVLQVVVEHVTKMPLAEIVEKYVFKPLGMNRSYYDLPPGEKDIASCYYTGYTPCESEWHVQPERGAAGVWTTPSDLLKLVRAVQGSLKADGDGDGSPKPFLKSETVKLMLTSVIDSMGLSWFVTQSIFHHTGGNNPGWRAFCFGYADLPWNQSDDEDSPSTNIDVPGDCGICVMTNSACGAAVYAKIVHAISYLKGWPLVADEGYLFSDAPFVALKEHGVDERWKEWIGDSWSKDWRINQDENGNPVAGVNGQGQGQVILRAAAIPAKRYGGEAARKSIDLILEGTEIMLRLGWDKDERVVEVRNGATGKSTTLRRTKT